MLLVARLAAFRHHSAGQLPAGPLAGSPEGLHVVRDTLRGVLTFQLGESGENVHHGASHGRGCVKGFLDGDKRDIMLLKDFIHGGKFLHVPADPVQFVHHDDIKAAGFHILHQLLEAWTVGVFSGKAFVLVVNPEFDLLVLVNNVRIVLAEPDLNLHGIAVVPVYRFPWINTDRDHGTLPVYFTDRRA